MPSRSLPSTRSIILAPLVLLTACAAPEGPDAPLGDVADAALARANDADLMSPDALEWLDDAIAERLGEALELRLEQQRIDPLGMHHARLSQAVDGIPVFAAAAVVHADAAGALRGITDGLLRDLDVDTTPRLSASQAVAQAVAGTDGPAPTEPPRAELMILRHEGEDHLAYRVEVRQLGLHPEPASWVVFVDAHDGHEVWRYDDLHRWALQSSLQTTWDAHGTTKLATATVGDSSDAVLYETYASVQAARKFLAKKAGRNSYDGAGAVVNAYGHYGSGYVNASWDPTAERMLLGDGDGVSFGHFGVTDIVAHELGHAIIAYEAGLVAWGESGALAETTGDIMGAAVSDYVGDGWVFNIGEDCWLPADPTVAFRYMGHPSDDGSSRDHYSDRYQGAADSGGIHFNSGIGNHFFYLLAQGGQHHDPQFRSGYVVTGLGIEAAFQIWYRALTVYMLPGTDFAGAREATEQAAQDLYGAQERLQVATAWYEVGVGGVPS